MPHDHATIDRLIRESNNQPVILLETLKPDHPQCRTLLFLDPIDILRADSPEKVTDTFAQIERHISAGRYAAGYVTYEAGYMFEPSLMPLSSGIEHVKPLVWFGIYDKPICEIPYGGTADEAGLSEMYYDHEFSITGQTGDWLNIENYRAAIARIKRYIASGDSYQINYTGQFEFSPPVSAYACYRRLALNQPVSYAAYISHDDISIISLSPELFFRTEKDRIWSRPMKGTIHRGLTTREDTILAEQLRTSIKDCAENVMIVDLIRNDLGKLCKSGSIHVPELFTVEKYNTLLQMTSTVEGTLRDGIGIGELFQALFPCGSVTGAPKLRSMEIIREIETDPRGVYTGAIGYAGPDGRSSFNVAIRSAVIRGERGSMGIGSGIVWDSDSDAEYNECMLKRRFFDIETSEEFSLIETMKCAHGRIKLLGLHLDRLIDSAVYFGFPVIREVIREKINSYTVHLDQSHIYKIRLLLHRNGDIDITSERFTIPDRTIIPSIVIASEHSDSTNCFLYHKTTNRAMYHKWFDIAQKHGYADILFTNERGEITEGCISNIFVKLGGEIVTPFQNCGLLDGVMRCNIMRRMPTIRECILTPDDIRHAERIWLTNAVRGIRKVVISKDGEELAV